MKKAIALSLLIYLTTACGGVYRVDSIKDPNRKSYRIWKNEYGNELIEFHIHSILMFLLTALLL